MSLITDLRTATAAAIAAALPDWQVLDSHPGVQGPGRWIVVLVEPEAVEWPDGTPPLPILARRCVLTLIASWTLADGAASWAATADALDDALAALLLGDPEWCDLAQPSRWERQAGVERQDRGLVGGCEIRVTCALPWSWQGPVHELLTAVHAAVSGAGAVVETEVTT